MCASHIGFVKDDHSFDIIQNGCMQAPRASLS